MPETFKKHFTHKEEREEEKEREETLKKKREKVFKLIEETEKEILSKPGKATIEDYQKITELTKKIERLFEEKEFFSEKAKEMLRNLKNTSLWDKKKEQWNRYINKEGELEGPNRLSNSQLLGVLTEAFSEKPDEFVNYRLYAR